MWCSKCSESLEEKLKRIMRLIIIVRKIAYIGPSGPIGYDYEHGLNTRYPNPLLEAPFGLAIMYDEVKFLHPAVCPKSMQKLDFVKFLSDTEDIQDYFDRIDSSEIDRYRHRLETMSIEELVNEYQIPADELQSLKNRMGPLAEKTDNHS
jgi:hypothetical protein